MKTYCVHIYPRMHEFEDIKAETPDHALTKVINREGLYHDQIDHTEVMITCQNCHTDNDLDEKKCGSCGKKL